MAASTEPALKLVRMRSGLKTNAEEPDVSTSVAIADALRAVSEADNPSALGQYWISTARPVLTVEDAVVA